MPAPRKYPDELRERAIREVRTSGRPIAHVAKDLGILRDGRQNYPDDLRVSADVKPPGLLHNPLMEPLPVPCPAHLIPVASGTGAFHKAYRQAMAHSAVFIAIESEGPRWTVKADTLTAGSGHAVDDTVNDAIRAAIVRLVHNHEAGTDAYTGPIYFMMHDVPSEERARELAAALHAALYGDLEPLNRAVPPTS